MSDWVSQSPWAVPAIAGHLVVLNHLRFQETGSPLFWIRALHIGRHLSPDDPRLAWAKHCLTDAFARVDALISRPPEKDKHWDLLIEALGFPMRPNYNPFREFGHILQRDDIYRAVLQHGKPLTGEGGAFLAVARKRGLTERTVNKIYYAAKNRVEQVSTK
jgi:hypothetical protein